jgi:hypothetical protein
VTFKRAEHSRLSRLGFGAAVLGLALAGLSFTATPAGAANNGNQGECPGGTTPVAKYEWKGSAFVAEFGGSIVTVTGNTSGGTWESSVPIDFVIVKGGTDSKGEDVDLNGAFEGTFTQDGLENSSEGGPAISHVTFCGGGTTTATPGASAVQCAGTAGAPGIIVTLTNSGDAAATFVVTQDGGNVGTADELTVTDAENEETISLPQVEDVATTIHVTSGAFDQSFPFASNCSTPTTVPTTTPTTTPVTTPVTAPVDECPDQDGLQTNPDQCLQVLPEVIVVDPPAEEPSEVQGVVVVKAPELPRTGATTGPLLVLGLALIVFGAAAMRLGRERSALI